MRWRSSSEMPWANASIGVAASSKAATGLMNNRFFMEIARLDVDRYDCYARVH